MSAFDPRRKNPSRPWTWDCRSCPAKGVTVMTSLSYPEKAKCSPRSLCNPAGTRQGSCCSAHGSCRQQEQNSMELPGSAPCLCSGVQSPWSWPWGMGQASGCWPSWVWVLPRILQLIRQPQWGSPKLRAAAVTQGASLYAAEAGLELCRLRSGLGHQHTWRHLHGAASLCTSSPHHLSTFGACCSTH